MAYKKGQTHTAAQPVQHLNEDALHSDELKRFTQLLLGGMFFAGCAGCLFIALLGNDPDLPRESAWIYLCFLVPLSIPLIKARRTKKLMGLARRYNSIFVADRDGTVTLEELVQQIGKPEEEILSDLEKLLQRGYLQRCTLRRQAPAAVILMAPGKGEMGFVEVTCPHCGGTSRLRMGSFGKCEYCGGAIRA